MRCSACWATTGISCTPVEPVPMTPTRLPLRSTSSLGQRLVNSEVPAKVSIPAMSGSSGTERMPDAATTNGAANDSPASVFTVHVASSSSNVIATTLVLNRMSRRRSSRSATKLRYASISGWAGIVSVHTHSCWISSEKL